MDKPRRAVRWRGSRKTLSHELAGEGQTQGALFPPPGSELPGTSYRYSCSKCGFLWAQEKCFVPETCIQCGHEAMYLGMKRTPPIAVDPSIPPNTLELRSRDGRVLGEIINIGPDPDEHIPFPED